MKTELIKVESGDMEELLQAPALALQQGEIVAFPTETVYGLGANALIETAVQQIFTLKGRPQDNPLIVHLPDKAKIEQVAQNIPEVFYQLYELFCPGPLTFILEKTDLIPDIVSAGLQTVAVRFPDQNVTQKLLRLADVPVVAPSANISGRPSATRALHVLDDFKGKIPFIIDDGATELGVESTVLDLCSPLPRILRPGIISASDIKERSGINVQSYNESLQAADLKCPAAPGLKYRHYAPNARVVQVFADREHSLEKVVLNRIKQFKNQKIGLFINEKTWNNLSREESIDENNIVEYLFPAEKPVESASRELYAAMRALDTAGVDIILAEAFPEAEAYMNRLDKACASDNLPINKKMKKILFVCTGNTCRSPMAAALFNAYAEKMQHDSVTSWQAFSAGLHTMDGLPVSEAAVSVLQEIDIDISGYRSVQLTQELLQKADMVATMTRGQRDLIREILPEQKNNIKMLSEWAHGPDEKHLKDVPDPFAQPEAIYRETRDHLQSLIVSLWQQINK